MMRLLANDVPAELLAILRYEPDTGLLFWAKAPRRGICPGTRAGKLSKGAFRVTYKGVSYGAHRVAWAIHYGSIPIHLDVDHKDLDQSNNRIGNLRLATMKQNRANVRVSPRCVSGMKGAHWNESKQKFASRIVIDGKTKFLGYYGSAAGAHAAYVQALTEARGEFARAA